MKSLLLLIASLLILSCNNSDDNPETNNDSYYLTRTLVKKDGATVYDKNFEGSCENKSTMKIEGSFMKSSPYANYYNSTTGQSECKAGEVKNHSYDSSQKTVNISGLTYTVKFDGNMMILSTTYTDSLEPGTFTQELSYRK